MSDKLEALSRLNFEKWMEGGYSPDRSPGATRAGEDAFKSVMWHIYSSAQLPLLAALEAKTKAHAAAIEQMHFHEQRADVAEQKLAAPTVSFYRDGIIAAAKWVDGQREAFDSENGRHDPDTGTFEFGNSAQEEHSSTLQDIAEGIRALHPQAEQQPIKLPDIRSEDYHESGWFQHMKYYRDVVRSIQVLELKVEGE